MYLRALSLATVDNKIRFCRTFLFIADDVLEYDLKAAGFYYGVPKNECSFISGQDDRIEDSPIGYYRYHYWINSDTSKLHENYVFIGKHVGYVCISLMKEKDGMFRVLFRSALGWKSFIVDSTKITILSKLSINTNVLKEAMRVVCENFFPDESSFHSGLSSPLNMATIGINTADDSSMKDQPGVSRNSSLNSIKSTFTLSALRSSFAGSQDSISFSRFGSMASLSDYTNASFEDLNLEDDQKINIIEDLTVKFFKTAYKVKDNSFPTHLLELEKALAPKCFNYDLIDLSKESGQSFNCFQQSLGKEINRKETINYVTILSEKYKMAEYVSPATIRKMEDSVKNSDMVHVGNASKLDLIIGEFIETEKNYLSQLNLLEKIFVSHLRNDDSGKFILKMKEFKDIFDGVVDFIPIHQRFIDNLCDGKGLDTFLSALNELISSKSLYSYQSYFTTYEKRIQALKSSLESNLKFSQFHDNCVNNLSELNKKGLDQIFISPIQRIPRYALLVREALKYVNDPQQSDNLKNIVDEIGKVAQFLNVTKHKSEQMEMLFTMQRKINNFPPDFLRAERTFLTKIACFTVDPADGKVSKTRLTIYLCNDMLIFAKKKANISGIITHDFILGINIKHVNICTSRNKKADKILFSTEIDMEHTCFTHNISDLDSTLFCRKKGSILSTKNENGTVSCSFQFSPKNQKKITKFISEFTETKNQNLLSESPARLIFKQDDKYDVFFHRFESKDQIQWENMSQVLIAYVEDEADLKEHLDFMSQYAAVAIVQGRSNTFRFMIGSKNPQFSDSDEPKFDKSIDLIDIQSFKKDFFKAILNAHLLVSIYPPFSKNVVQQRRFVLESAVASSKSRNLSSICKGSAIKGFFSSITGNSDKSSGDRLSRGSSLKTGSSPLSSPIKASNAERMEELKREIRLDSSMSLLHL